LEEAGCVARESALALDKMHTLVTFLLVPLFLSLVAEGKKKKIGKKVDKFALMY
jgi:hypothetical protein